MVENCTSKNVFDANKKGLFFDLLSDKVYTIEGESCNGENMLKERLTLTICIPQQQQQQQNKNLYYK